jgi:hypothetical protein
MSHPWKGLNTTWLVTGDFVDKQRDDEKLTFRTVSSGSVLFVRSNLLQSKDLYFSYLRLGLIRHRRNWRSSHLFLECLVRFYRTRIREADILINICVGIQIVLSRSLPLIGSPSNVRFSVSLFVNKVTSDESRRVQSFSRVLLFVTFVTEVSLHSMETEPQIWDF